jgi:hypothetical protein
MALYRSAFALACVLLAAASPAFSADLGPGPGASYVEPAPVNPWKFSFTPYGWFTGINGNVTARGHTVDVDESFIEIAEHADSFAAISKRARADGDSLPMRCGPISAFPAI